MTPPADDEDDEAVRAILAKMSDGHLSELLSAARFYSTMRPEVRKFLYNAEPETLEFLTRARMEEIRLLEQGIRLVSSSQTVGNFMKWVFITAFGAFILASQFGEAIQKLFGWKAK